MSKTIFTLHVPKRHRKMTFTNILVIFLSIAVAVNGDNRRKFFVVTNYGAVADGRTDNGPAFLKAWNDACAYHGKSAVWVPRGTYMVGSVSFVGPCNGPIAFLIKGSLRAPTDPNKFYTDKWIGFRYVDHLTLSGGGYLDGQGQFAWPYNDCHLNQGCKPLPASLGFDFVKNSKIQRLRSINSKETHIKIFASSNINISQIRITAPQYSPNTDGIKIGLSSNIYISDSIISTGDDCVAMIAGSKNIDISRVACGPGHGISIGSLGQSHEKDFVMGIRVRNCSFIGTDNGVRIKTWAPSLVSLASDIIFEDIYMSNVSNPIVIDQQYCPHNRCLQGHSSAVQVQNVLFKNIKGTSQTEVAVNLKCSRAWPCKNVKLVNINLSYNNLGGKSTATCSNVMGTSYGRQLPVGCF
ncbi:hypothetical protein CASFOL_002151 [Castilleja foliolosa]|uniref:Exopolygalacturonase n=1 Tax=Castilleja foliolosa TaxID=1961234 RepID=A0ABD3EDF6_9LAMI